MGPHINIVTINVDPKYIVMGKLTTNNSNEQDRMNSVSQIFSTIIRTKQFASGSNKYKQTLNNYKPINHHHQHNQALKEWPKYKHHVLNKRPSQKYKWTYKWAMKNMYKEQTRNEETIAQTCILKVSIWYIHTYDNPGNMYPTPIENHLQNTIL